MPLQMFTGYFMFALMVFLIGAIIAALSRTIVVNRKSKKAYKRVSEVFERQIAINYNGVYAVMSEEQYITIWKQMNRREKRDFIEVEKKNSSRQAEIKRKIELGEIIERRDSSNRKTKTK